MRGNGAGLGRGWGERADKAVRDDERGTAAEDGRHVARLAGGGGRVRPRRRAKQRRRGEGRLTSGPGVEFSFSSFIFLRAVTRKQRYLVAKTLPSGKRISEKVSHAWTGLLGNGKEAYAFFGFLNERTKQTVTDHAKSKCYHHDAYRYDYVCDDDGV